ncbi:MAG: peptidoglycan DD-metalloendopeptidase family protein, partial [Solirubrobacterales bacterium]|nr:peptidoglycan DD-metalloendopeptidase family protein [Solirubrobacterales bacterium]
AGRKAPRGTHADAQPAPSVRVDGRRATRPDGAPTTANPTYSLALGAPAPIGVPSFFIDKFRIPPFLLPIYQAAGIEYGVRWEVLAAINEIETDYGRNLNVSSAGAQGWMQFMPATWKRYGVDANRDGKEDPYNPVDAIFAAARYLKAAGAEQDIRKAVFAYNHADWYVDSVMMRSRLIAGIPADLVGSLTGLTQGRFPVDATTRYARTGATGRLFAAAGSPVVAVQDGRVIQIGRTRRHGRFVRLRDVYGNTYTYGRLGSVARSYTAAPRPPVAAPATLKVRLFANPTRPAVIAQLRKLRTPPSRRLKVGSLVKGGTVLGKVGDGTRRFASHLAFEIRPAGRGAPRIDPKPILDGWELLESTAIYRTSGKNPLLDERGATVGQILLMSKSALTRRVLANPRIELYPCGRRDVAAGIIDRRVLAALEFLAASGMRPTVSSLRCGHSYLTAGGNVSHHSSGTAVDISRINGIPVMGHQGEGSITDLAVRRLLTLQGTMRPSQIITLMTYTGASNTLALPDHDDHIHVGWLPRYGTKAALRYEAVLKPSQWIKLIDRLGRIDNPTLRTATETIVASVPDVKRHSKAHHGE